MSLVAILDADKEGFLRSARSLIQTAGRAARNIRGTVVMFADHETAAIRQAVEETQRRRTAQLAYNAEHGITPRTVTKAILDMSPTSGNRDYVAFGRGPSATRPGAANRVEPELDLAERAEQLRQLMLEAAENLEFEKAARLRDELRALRAASSGELRPDVGAHGSAASRGRGARRSAAPRTAAGRRASRGRKRSR